MANTVNATWQGSGPAFTNQLVAFGGKDVQEMAYRGYITFTGDASTAGFTVNFIDGTQTPFYTQANPPTTVAPKLVLVGPMIGTASSACIYQTVASITASAFTVTTSAAIPANSYTVPFIVIP
jgi:hypothetical protein